MSFPLEEMLSGRLKMHCPVSRMTGMRFPKQASPSAVANSLAQALLCFSLPWESPKDSVGTHARLSAYIHSYFRVYYIHLNILRCFGGTVFPICVHR